MKFGFRSVDFWGFGFLFKMIIMEFGVSFFVWSSIFFLSATQGLICCSSNRGEKVTTGHFKEIRIGFLNIYFLRIGSKQGV